MPDRSFDNNKRVERAIRDCFFTCNGRAFVKALYAAGQRDLYLYRFNFTINDIEGKDLRDYHGAEMPYVWYSPKENWSPKDYALADEMSTYWTCFAHDHFQSACSVKSPAWPRYEPALEQSLTFDQPVVVQSGYDEDRCDMWDAIGYDF